MSSHAMESGKYYWMVGDSSSGKTFLTLTFLAEASINKAFDDYDLVFDNAEDGALMDMEKFFGPRLVERLQAPRYVDGEPVHSRTADEFYFHLDDRVKQAKKKERKPFIYLLDSMDALDTEYSEKKFQERKSASRKGKDAKGDYGDGKAKTNSQRLRSVVQELRDSGSILIILSQTRDNINAESYEPKQTHAGGKSLKFYATWQLWSSVGVKLKKTVNDKERQIGVISKIGIRKNRLSGKEWDIKLPIYWSTGIDDIGSCIDFLVEEGHWKEKDGKINATDFEFEGRRATLIKQIESEELELDLRVVVTQVWRSIEEKCTVSRKNRYH